MPGIEQLPTFQFGIFELNARTGELRKHGVKLKLQEQPAQILTLLLAHAGEVVTREEIPEASLAGGHLCGFRQRHQQCRPQTPGRLR
jgi:DNA-binding response OmpR family regulator